MNVSLLALGSVVGLRFFGLFVVMPLLSVYAASKVGASDQIVGLIMGAYAASQLVFQFPFGYASDKWGRKPVIIIGLLIFAIGSIVAAFADSATTLLIGRFLQGAGSISAVTTALAADLTPENKRGKAMATLGGFIAMSFIVAMLIGPVLGSNWGVDKLFELTAVLGALAALVLLLFVPKPPVYKNLSHKATIGALFENRSLNMMYLFIFFHGFLLTNMFFVLPLELTRHFGWSPLDSWMLYVPSTILGMVAMVPAAILSEKRGLFKQVTIIGVAFFLVGFLICATAINPIMFCVGGVVFFMGFNMLEPILQSAASKYAKAALRGKALATFTSFQYLGVFIGGMLGGILMHSFSSNGVLWMLVFIATIWLIFAFIMSKPPLAGFAFFAANEVSEVQISALEQTQGILDFYANDETVTVKFDKQFLSQADVEKILGK